MIKGWTVRYPVRNGSANVISLPTFTVPQLPTTETAGGRIGPVDKTSTSVVVSEVFDTSRDRATTPNIPPAICELGSPCSSATIPQGSISVHYQSSTGQVSSDVTAGEPLSRTSPLVVKLDGLPIVCRTKVSPSGTRTSYFQTQGPAPLPHPPAIHPPYDPEPSDIFMHIVSDGKGDIAYQVWMLSDDGGRLTWVTVDSPHKTTHPGGLNFVLSFNTPAIGAPSPTWVKEETARRKVPIRLYQLPPHTFS